MIDILELIVTPQVAAMLLAGIAAFATVLTIMMPAFNRDRVGTRMKAMAVEREKLRNQRLSDFAGDKAKLRMTSKGFMTQVVEQLNLRKTFETDELRDKLKMAGLRGQAPLMAFIFFRLVGPILMLTGALFHLFVVNDFGLAVILRLGIALLASYVGFYLPNMFISNLIQRRQTALNLAFPDALDLLLICVQSGMSIEASFGKVAKEITAASLELAEEFHITTAELSYLSDRRQAYENFAKRTGVPAIKAVCMSLVQTERYGTPVGQALRVMAKENRDLRMSNAEKKAAALPPKLTVPMIVFNLPVLFAVILGPAVINYFKLQAGEPVK
jgi:tight adherence protein C